MFIIPCKFDPEKPYIQECVEAVHKFHPDERVVVVDSASDDTGYFFDLPAKGVEFWDVNNGFYGTNAFALVYGNYPHEDHYYCIYDSLILQDNISYLEEYDVTAFRYFNTPPTGWGFDSNSASLQLWAQSQYKWLVPKVFRGIVGPMFVASNAVMRDLEEFGIFDILPTDKYQLCAMERIYGFHLENRGYDFWTHSPQGEMIDFFGQYPEDKVRKINAARM